MGRHRRSYSTTQAAIEASLAVAREQAQAVVTPETVTNVTPTQDELTTLTDTQLVAEIDASIDTIRLLSRKAHSELRTRLLPFLREIRYRFKSREAFDGFQTWGAFLYSRGLSPEIVRKWEQRDRNSKRADLPAPTSYSDHDDEELTTPLYQNHRPLDEEEDEDERSEQGESWQRFWINSEWLYANQLRLTRDEERSVMVEGMSEKHPRDVAEHIYDTLREFADELATARKAPTHTHWPVYVCIRGDDMSEMLKRTNRAIAVAYMDYYKRERESKGATA